MSVSDYSDYNARRLLQQTAADPAGMPVVQFEDLPGTSRRIRESVVANRRDRFMRDMVRAEAGADVVVIEHAMPESDPWRGAR